MPISLLILILFTYLVSGNAWIRQWAKLHDMTDKHPWGTNLIEMHQNYF